MKLLKRLLLFLLIAFTLFLITAVLLYNTKTDLTYPKIENQSALELERQKIDSNFYVLGNNWLKQNEYGIWEMYIEGKAFERGVIHGKLAKELVQEQEQYFVDQIREMVPSEFYLRFLKYFVRWFNRDIDQYIPEEFKTEIYGISFSADSQYNFIGNNYERILNYHAAHDIGHALQNLALVGCTSFSTWGNKSANGDLLLGRNFDFYVGEKFARDKIILFIHPEKGHNLALVTWGGFIGAVSGMNQKGLSVTMNAAKSNIPGAAATPISIIGREILQYAGNIQEAFEIAQKRQSFVSESIMIGSKSDGKTALIEITPDTSILFLPEKNTAELLCSNHFRSDYLANQELHKQDRNQTASVYRFERLQELLSAQDSIAPIDIANILRNRRGLGDTHIGEGNEKALNQLLAHHAVIFNLTQKIFWLSANPFQLGAFVPYQLDSIFAKQKGLKTDSSIYLKAALIPADPFIKTAAFDQFLTFKQLSKKIKKAIAEQGTIQENELNLFEQSNPKLYQTHWLLGQYYATQNDCEKAKEYFKKALKLEIPNQSERVKIEEEQLNCS